MSCPNPALDIQLSHFRTDTAAVHLSPAPAYFRTMTRFECGDISPPPARFPRRRPACYRRQLYREKNAESNLQTDPPDRATRKPGCREQFRAEGSRML